MRETMYTAGQIKPKRYLEEKPSEENKYWCVGKRGPIAYWYRPFFKVFPGVDESVTWFIDIPGAPPELKPLPYPQNKPSENGVYWVHYKNDDAWHHWVWDESCPNWSNAVDWFIPVRLDRKGKEVERAIWKDDTLIVKVFDHPFIDREKLIMFTTSFEGVKPMDIEGKVFTEIARHWLDLQNENRKEKEMGDNILFQRMASLFYSIANSRTVGIGAPNNTYSYQVDKSMFDKLYEDFTNWLDLQAKLDNGQRKSRPERKRDV